MPKGIKTQLDKALARGHEVLATEITEMTCKRFMDWCGYMDAPPFELKADIYHEVIKAVKRVQAGEEEGIQRTP